MTEAALRLFRDEVRRGLVTSGRYAQPVPPGKGACTQVALQLRDEFGWEAIAGDFDDGDMLWLHCWNRQPDGTVVDATADQFGYDDVLIAAPGDPRLERYIEIGVLGS